MVPTNDISAKMSLSCDLASYSFFTFLKYFISEKPKVRFKPEIQLKVSVSRKRKIPRRLTKKKGKFPFIHHAQIPNFHLEVKAILNTKKQESLWNNNE